VLIRCAFARIVMGQLGKTVPVSLQKKGHIGTRCCSRPSTIRPHFKVQYESLAWTLSCLNPQMHHMVSLATKK